MYYLVIIGLIVIDQLIKVVVRSNFQLFDSVNILGELLQFTYIENRGAAFSMMSGQRLILVLLPVLMIAAAFVFLIWKGKEHSPILSYSISAVIAGGLSNLFDRIAFGSVTDYIDLKGFAVFNFADICICVGCFFVCIYMLFLEGRESSDK